jgi:hypothetical protein
MSQVRGCASSKTATQVVVSNTSIWASVITTTTTTTAAAGSKNNSVSVVTRLAWMTNIQIPGKEHLIFYPQCSEWHWRPIQLPMLRVREVPPGSKVAGDWIRKLTSIQCRKITTGPRPPPPVNLKELVLNYAQVELRVTFLLKVS